MLYVHHEPFLRSTSIPCSPSSRTIYSAAAWRLCVGTVACISKSVSVCIAKSRLSPAREVNSTPLDVSEVGKVDKMPAEATEWRFSMRRDIMVTLMQLANDVKQPLSKGVAR